MVGALMAEIRARLMDAKTPDRTTREFILDFKKAVALEHEDAGAEAAGERAREVASRGGGAGGAAGARGAQGGGEGGERRRVCSQRRLHAAGRLGGEEGE